MRQRVVAVERLGVLPGDLDGRNTRAATATLRVAFDSERPADGREALARRALRERAQDRLTSARSPCGQRLMDIRTVGGLVYARFHEYDAAGLRSDWDG